MDYFDDDVTSAVESFLTGGPSTFISGVGTQLHSLFGKEEQQGAETCTSLPDDWPKWLDPALCSLTEDASTGELKGFNDLIDIQHDNPDFRNGGRGNEEMHMHPRLLNHVGRGVSFISIEPEPPWICGDDTLPIPDPLSDNEFGSLVNWDPPTPSDSDNQYVIKPVDSLDLIRTSVKPESFDDSSEGSLPLPVALVPMHHDLSPDKQQAATLYPSEDDYMRKAPYWVRPDLEPAVSMFDATNDVGPPQPSYHDFICPEPDDIVPSTEIDW
ncbi:hypothetical protein QFC19_003373 [Naganishia cerealis]|uniref:Uncharacterized protein n=1 Tax=Naganishia cerealis TaxID=610337 RepID=A0ACC2W239_9TREE|nr:hypothetical protein QFC19_003373 [Naganishia cerealis]